MMIMMMIKLVSDGHVRHGSSFFFDKFNRRTDCNTGGAPVIHKSRSLSKFQLQSKTELPKAAANQKPIQLQFIQEEKNWFSECRNFSWKLIDPRFRDWDCSALRSAEMKLLPCQLLELTSPLRLIRFEIRLLHATELTAIRKKLYANDSDALYMDYMSAGRWFDHGTSDLYW